ncbi:hypothetical protein [Paenibacillus hamazuiensis]|uniref:hypothetical protein n=1 Tax=Paenibacillus hamazuiensis TaxID=2936508 RepID=UPI00200F3398|nr:hypothetical protein [Paenibacillus hamazuiensis]
MLLVLLDADTLFLDMVSAYVRTTELAERFTVKSFSSREQGLSFLETAREKCILLIHESFFPLPDRVFEQPLGCTLFLSNSPSASDVLEYPMLFKYQPLNQLMAQVAAHYNEYTSSAPIRGKQTTEVVAVYSATGGTGKTALSLHWAMQSALLDRSVFYLNLELHSGLHPLLAASGKDLFAQAVYYAKTNPKQLAARLGSLVSYHPLYKFSYLETSSYAEELLEMGESEVIALIDAIAATGEYRTIVIDLESSLHPRIIGAISRCDRLMWMVLDEAQQLQKTLHVLKMLRDGAVPGGGEWIGKAELIVNKHTGKLSNRLEKLGLRIAGELPYIPQWKSYGEVEQLLHCPPFQEQVLRLMQEGSGMVEVKRVAGA